MSGIAFKVATVGAIGGLQLMDYKSKRDAGHGVVASVGKMAIETALWTNPVTMPIMAGVTAAQLVGAGAQAVAEYGKTGGRLVANQMSAVHSGGRGALGGNFMDTNNASTMRQRGLQAMEHSGYNVRSVLGSEARTYYQRY